MCSHKTVIFYRFLPYGNGKVEGDDKIICQHGSAECTGNTINDCVKVTSLLCSNE